ncbi:MAG TPA: GxxExxY protein [Candidatus Acidoferrum sp.]|nr:GxxExxY protein [Candidatus Acidoferrum sp.]
MKTFIEPNRKTDELARAVIGAAIEVHRQLGPGFLESIYEEALGIELEGRNIPFERQKEISVLYKRRQIGGQRIDLLVGDSLIVELKAVDALADIHTAQVISYLKATGLSLGLLINFNVPVLKQGVRRIIHGATVMTPGVPGVERELKPCRSLRLGG